MKIETGDPFITKLMKAVKTGALGFTKVTACNAPSSDGGYDIMLFPANKKFIGLTETDIPALTRVLQGEPDVGNVNFGQQKSLAAVCETFFAVDPVGFEPTTNRL